MVPFFYIFSLDILSFIFKQRTTNNIGGDAQEKSSVKVSNPAGGKSQFSLGWGSDEVDSKASKKQFGNQNQSSFNIFGAENPAEKPSVKVPFE